jgi:hypothetical protein
MRTDGILKKLEDLDVVIIAAAHNHFKTARDNLEGLPWRFANPSPENKERIGSLIVVGGVDAMGRLGYHSPWTDWLVMAPAYEVFTATLQGRAGYDSEKGIAWGGIGNSYGRSSLIPPPLSTLLSLFLNFASLSSFFPFLGGRRPLMLHSGTFDCGARSLLAWSS